MIYILEFFGLLAIAGILAASPFLIDLLESIVTGKDDRARSRSTSGYGYVGGMSNERLEMRNEIRRMTDILETDTRESARASSSSKKK